MSEKSVPYKYPINASPTADHRRQMRLQVWLPLVITLLVVLALAALTIFGAVQGSPQVERWGAISAILVIIPVLIWGIVFLVITGAVLYGVSILLKKMPDWMLKLQLQMMRLSLGVRRAANVITQPVIKTNTFSARVSRLWERVVHGK